MQLQEIFPGKTDILLSLAYATHNNFTGHPIYKRAACYLHPHAVKNLMHAANLASELGLRLKIFDAFRPVEAQWRMWQDMPNSEYLANPKVGSPHSRGTAVDLTLTRADGQDLKMGTLFDTFKSDSHHSFLGLRTAEQRNRNLLLGIMTAAGWDYYSNEWWHYQLFHSSKYPLLSDKASGTNLI